MLHRILENGHLQVVIPFAYRRISARKRIIVPRGQIDSQEPLALGLARAFRWQALIDSGVYENVSDLARAIGEDHAFVARTIRMTLLAPEIVHAILAGTLKKSIPMELLRKEMPILWEDQKKQFGID